MSQTIEIKGAGYRQLPRRRRSKCWCSRASRSAKDSAAGRWKPTKATMEVPSSHAGVVKEYASGRRQGSARANVVCLLEVSEAGAADVAATPAPGSCRFGSRSACACCHALPRQPPQQPLRLQRPRQSVPRQKSMKPASASLTPARRCANLRVNWVSIWVVNGSGPKGRITQ